MLSPLASSVLQALVTQPNILLYGPPGTGKTRAMQELWELFSSSSSLPGIGIDPTQRDAPIRELPKTGNSPFTPIPPGLPIPTPIYLDWLTFHQSFSYEEFIIGVRPEPLPKNAGIQLRPRAGRLLEAVNAVLESKGSAVLFIDELNRGNPAQIFGEFITFLERDKRLQQPFDGSTPPGKAVSTSLPFHLPGVNLNSPNQTEAITFRSGQIPLAYPVYVPYHLYIIASMNSLDRSVAPLDQALARRFHRIGCRPDFGYLMNAFGLAGHIDELKTLPLSQLSDQAAFGAVAVLLLVRVNTYIRFTLGEDYELGHGYLTVVTNQNSPEESWGALAEAWDTRILPQLEELFRTRPESLAMILKANDKSRPDFFPYRTESGPADLDERERVISTSTLQELNFDQRRQALAFLSVS